MSAPVKIIIPSHKRAERVTTRHVVADAAICVPFAQVEEYTRYNPECEIIGHPDEIIGLAPKRQWIYETFKNVFMLDDDITEFKRLYVTSNYRVNNKQLVRDIIYQTAISAKESGAFLFGFSKNNNPTAYRSLSPISLTGFINGCAHGLLEGSKLWYNPRVTAVEDYWISCLNAHYHRYCWKDMRFTFIQQATFMNPGGQSDFRNLATEKADYEFLVKCFGSEVIRIKKESSLRKLQHPYEKTINLPF